MNCFALHFDYRLTMLTENIKALSMPEKLLLINELWEDISAEIDESPLSEEQNALLDLRYEAFLNAPQEGKSWAQMKKNLKALL